MNGQFASHDSVQNDHIAFGRAPQAAALREKRETAQLFESFASEINLKNTFFVRAWPAKNLRQLVRIGGL